ncbi:M1 family aminopeptidase [Chitinophaga lutea]
MVYRQIKQALLLAMLTGGAGAMAQQAPGGGYDPVAAFAPLPQQSGRNASGVPGPGYWQNRADYKVAVSIDTLSRGVNGAVSIVYTNNSPDALPFIWLSTGQNRFRKDSRETLLTPPQGSRFGTADQTDGLVIESFKTQGQDAGYRTNGGHIRVALPRPLAPGKQVQLDIRFHYTLPAHGADFSGILKTEYGNVYQYSSVFPRVCVYDDQRGWNTSPVQYYVEHGSLDMQFTAPANMIVQGTGLLQNPEAVLRPAILNRYRRALSSDTVVKVRSANEPHAPEGAGTLTWRFTDANAGDGMWAASAAFHWDALGTKLPDGKRLPTMALYPPGSHREWDTIARVMSGIVREYVKKWSDYPYAVTVNIAGSITGVANPGVSVLHYANSSMGSTIWIKTNHEIGHAWFNLMVAGDNLCGWMCEGQNTFINNLNADALGGPKAFMRENAVDYLSTPNPKAPAHTAFGSIPLNEMGPLLYMKPAYAFELLRNEVLGPERFDDAFRRYIQAWAFKHPTPQDFFRMMENASGEELSWFWRSWLLTDARLDQGITKVSYVDKSPLMGIYVTIVNKREMPMPVELLVREFSGKTHRVRLPAQVWEKSGTHTLKVPTATPVITVTIDPDKKLPDMDRSDNSWIEKSMKLNNSKLTAQQVIDRYFEAVGGKALVTKTNASQLQYTFGPSGQFSHTLQQAADGKFSWTLALAASGRVYELKKLASGDSMAFNRMTMPQQLFAKEKDQLRRSAQLFPELLFFEAGNKVSVSDSLQLVHGMETYLVTVSTPAGNTWKYYYDAASGLKVREELTGGNALLFESRVMSAYEAREGIRIPGLLLVTTTETAEAAEEIWELKSFIKS